MLKRKLCEATFQWKLECEGPLLIADGRYSQKEVMKPFEGNDNEKKKRGGWYPDKFFINHTEPSEMIKRVRDAGCNPPNPEWNFYVPATSIRGPFRARAERIIRSLLLENASHSYTACDPFDQDEENHSQFLGCSKRLEKENGNTSKYAGACPACKLFGCAGLASRIYFTDADIEPGYSSTYRDMIGIDRFTGGVYKGGGEGGSKGANMRFHVLENTTFITTVTITNFELWHLGLMAYVFRDFEDGMVPIGFGKTKGFGQVKGKVTELTLTYPKVFTHIEHIGSLMSSATERTYYGIYTCAAPSFEYTKPKNSGLSLYKSVTVTNIHGFWAEVAPAFNNYIEKLNHQVKEKVS